jgi:hypothetical protein
MTQTPADLTPADVQYTALTTLLWQLYERAQELNRTTLAADLVVAGNELRNGPWRHAGGAPGRLSLPFTAACQLVDELLDQLYDVSTGLAARVAIEATREILEGNRPQERFRPTLLTPHYKRHACYGVP